MTGQRIMGVLLLLFSLGVLGFVVDRIAARGRFAAPYSIHGGGPHGTRALATFLAEEGRTVRPLSREIAHLTGGTLIAISGCHGAPLRELARLERERLARFVDTGGLLIVAGAYDFIPEALGIRIAQRADCGPTDGSARKTPVPVTTAHAVGAPLAHLEAFSVENPTTLDALPFADATALIDSALGPIAYTALLGRGRVVILGMPDALTNAAIERGGGALVSRLIHAFAPPGPVLFDEYHLGMGERRSLTRYLRDRGLAPSLVQGLLMIVCGLLVGRLRLLPVRASAPPRRRPASLTRALAHLYAEARDPRGAALRVERAALRGHVPPGEPADTPGDAEDEHWLGIANRALARARAALHKDRS